ncbi:MAG: type III pantothenate kinase [Oceanococcus sp.]
MMLLVDAGNTQVKLRSWQQGQLGALQRLDKDGNALSQYAGACALISCVATPQRTAQLDAQLSQHQIQANWLKSPKHGLGIRNAYAEPEKLGVDRWLALAAAYAQCGQTCCVIDAGTAITFDICDDHGQHLGGLIAPGLNALRLALRKNTDLPEVTERGVPITKQNWLAQNTLDALQFGALQSACGLIERSIRLAQDQHACDKVFLTGGDAAFLQPFLQNKVLLNENLVFQGLALIAHEACTQDNDPL